MNTPFDFKDADQSNLVYVRPVAVADLPDEVRDELLWLPPVVQEFV